MAIHHPEAAIPARSGKRDVRNHPGKEEAAFYRCHKEESTGKNARQPPTGQKKRGGRCRHLPPLQQGGHPQLLSARSASVRAASISWADTVTADLLSFTRLRSA